MGDMTGADEYLEATHAIGNHLLRVLDDTCTSLGIRYFLTSGTLLGAVRHEGWIPWDDDVDVIFLREDFEQFRSRAPEVLPRGVFYSDGRNNPDEHITSLPRLIFTQSQRHIGRTRSNPPIETRHVALDVFVLDAAPGNKTICRAWRQAVYLLERISFARYSTLGDVLREPSTTRTRKFSESIAVLSSRILSRLAWHKLHATVARLPARLGCRDVLVSTNYTTPHGRFARFSREWYSAQTKVQFEGLSVPAPVDTPMVLTTLFGPDYMTPPLAQEREPLHLRDGLYAELDERVWDTRSAH